MSIINLNILREEKPYFIVVSDEGPASSPKQHPDFASAYDESLRLAKLHPNVKFGVFEYKGHAIGSKPKKTTTRWINVYNKMLPVWHNTKESAKDGCSFGKGKTDPDLIGTYPVETEVPSETTVRFNTFTKPLFQRPHPSGFWPLYTYPQDPKF
jgi:hypothetical protein